MSNEPLIVTVIKHYHPQWEAPKKGIYPWLKCLCPWHGDTYASASVSYEYDAFKCHACGVRGTAVSIIKQQEGVTFAEAKRIAESLSQSLDGEVPPQSQGEPSGGVHRKSWAELPEHQAGDGQVHARVRTGRPTWA